MIRIFIERYRIWKAWKKHDASNAVHKLLVLFGLNAPTFVMEALMYYRPRVQAYGKSQTALWQAQRVLGKRWFDKTFENMEDAI